MSHFISAPSSARITRAMSAIVDRDAKRLLIVDDEDTIRTALARFMRARGYEVDTAESAEMALELLARDKFHVVLSDIRMPGMSGVDLVSRALALDPDLAIVILSALNDAPTATQALSRGALDYLMKPVELAELHAAVGRALKKRELAIEQRRVEQLIREEVAVRTAELEREKVALRTMTVSIAETLIIAMESKDPFLRGHSQRVAELSASIADGLGLDEDTVEHIRMAGRLHDIGKIGVREEVLHKSGPLTGEELAHVRDHIRIGMQILAPLRHIGAALQYVQDHHEHWDGSGYPRGLKGEHISIGGRIIAAADAFDALTSKRPYREPFAAEEALEYLTGLSGRLLDPQIFPALERVVLRRKALPFLTP